MKREDLFVVTKIWHDEYENPEESLKKSLGKLKLDYVDCYLVHWPNNLLCPSKKPMHVLWAEMEALVEKGLTKSIGVSNFNVQLLSDILTYCKIKPVCNQIQIYPRCAQVDLVKFLLDQDILPVAYSPMGRFSLTSKTHYDISGEKTIHDMAEKYGKSPAQIMLNWGLCRGYAVIPKSASEKNQIGNMEAMNFRLSDEDVAKITTDCNK